jgi:exodeoxyribonuclease VII small subunit
MAETAPEEPKEMTFAQGYERLQDICEELGRGELDLDGTIDLLKEGHGIERRLRERLEACEQELKEIEAGQGLTDVRIVG